MLLDASVTSRLVTDFAARRPVPVRGLEALTSREHEVLLEVAHGLSNAEIAARLVIAEETVESHVSEILRKAATPGTACSW